MKYIIYYLESHFAGYAPMIRIAVLAVFILISLYIIALLTFQIIAFRRKLQKRRTRRVYKKYRKKLMEIFYLDGDLSFEDISEKLVPTIKFNLDKKWFKEIITDLIITLKKAETEHNKLNIGNYNSVLVYFGLEKFWADRITSHGVASSIKALRKLESLTNQLSASVVAPLLHHRDKELRKLARSEFMKFESDNAYQFMEEVDFDKDMNRLDEIRLHESLKKIHERQGYLPQLTQWIKKANNEKFKCFVIREVGFFMQEESAPYFMELFTQSSSVNVKGEIVDALGALRYKPALPLLVSEFASSSLQIQNKIIKAVGRIGRKESLSFLKDIYPYAYNGDMENNIIDSIKKCGGDCDKLLAVLPDRVKQAVNDNNVFPPANK